MEPSKYKSLSLKRQFTTKGIEEIPSQTSAKATLMLDVGRSLNLLGGSSLGLIRQALIKHGIFFPSKKTPSLVLQIVLVSVMWENDIKNIATFDEDFGKIKGINTVGLWLQNSVNKGKDEVTKCRWRKS